MGVNLVALVSGAAKNNPDMKYIWESELAQRNLGIGLAGMLADR